MENEVHCTKYIQHLSVFREGVSKKRKLVDLFENKMPHFGHTKGPGKAWNFKS